MLPLPVRPAAPPPSDLSPNFGVGCEDEWPLGVPRAEWYSGPNWRRVLTRVSTTTSLHSAFHDGATTPPLPQEDRDDGTGPGWQNLVARLANAQQKESARRDSNASSLAFDSINLKSTSSVTPKTLSTTPDVSFKNGEWVVRLTGPDDPFSPLNMSTARKWTILAIISLATMTVTCGSSMVTFTYAAVQEEWGIGTQVATLSLSLWVFAMGIGPLFLAPLSEFYGSQRVYLISYLAFLVANAGVGFAANFETWLICRFIGGLFGSAFLSVAGGTVSDIWAPTKVAAPMGVYTTSMFLGPVLGPVFSGFINQQVQWRWTWFALVIWVATKLVLLAVLVPETYLPALLVKKAKRLREGGRAEVKAPQELDPRSIPVVIMSSCTRPFQILALEPMALLICIWTALVLGEIYLFFGAFSTVYGAFGFSMSQTGMAFLGIGRKAKAVGGKPPPEEHLRRGMLGAAVAPLALFAFAFTTYPRIHWIASIIASSFFGFSSVLCLQAAFAFLVDAYRPVAASAMAANSFLRCSFAAAFPLFAPRMFTSLGTQWAIALCAFLNLAIAPVPFLFFYHGQRFRRVSRFTSEGQEQLAKAQRPKG